MNSKKHKLASPTLRHRLNWPLVLTPAAMALIRPLSSITGLSDSLGNPATPLSLTAAIFAAWIGIGVLSRVRDPLLTLIAAGLTYALAPSCSAECSPSSWMENWKAPSPNPQAIVPVSMTNAAWGALCGICALGLRRDRGHRG
jgi:hypothetical protein